MQSASVMPIMAPNLLPNHDNLLEKKPQTLTHTVKRGETFMSILSELDIPRTEAHQFVNSLKPLGIPSLFPGDSIVVNKDANGKVKALSLLNRMQLRYTVTAQDSSIRAEKQKIAQATYRSLISGTVESSLSEEMAELGINGALTSKFVDIFAWDINFFLDPRKGDTFQILFEQKFAEGRFVGYGEILAARYICDGKDYTAFAVHDSEGKISYYDIDGKAVQKQFLKAPLSFSRISSGFTYNRKHPVLGIVRPHLGIDYAAPRGTPVYAAADGTIQFSGWKGGFGNYVIISHGASSETHYGHLHRISKGLSRGKRVQQGELIGTVGSTGLSTGPHLDYRMKMANKFVNPLTISLPSKQAITAEQQSAFSALKQEYLSALSLRFGGKEGLYIVDIEPGIPEQPQVSISMN